MSGRRFDLIQKFLHLADNSQITLDVLSENWQKSSHLSIYSYLNLKKILFHINKYALMNHY